MLKLKEKNNRIIYLEEDLKLLKKSMNQVSKLNLNKENEIHQNDKSTFQRKVS